MHPVKPPHCRRRSIRGPPEPSKAARALSHSQHSQTDTPPGDTGAFAHRTPGLWCGAVLASSLPDELSTKSSGCMSFKHESRGLERETRFELATCSLEGCRFLPTELLPPAARPEALEQLYQDSPAAQGLIGSAHGLARLGDWHDRCRRAHQRETTAR